MYIRKQQINNKTKKLKANVGNSLHPNLKIKCYTKQIGGKHYSNSRNNNK